MAPPRVLVVKDIDGNDVRVSLHRVNEQTATTFRRDTTSELWASVATAYGTVATVYGAVGLAPAPRVLHPSGISEGELAVEETPTAWGVAQPAARNGWSTAHLRTVAPSGAPHTVQEYFAAGTARWYGSNYTAFDRPTAERILRFIAVFNEHFESGASAQAGRASKEAKLGRALVLRKALDVWHNPTGYAQNFKAEEHLTVTCYPDSGTDALKLESDSKSHSRPPLSTSMQVIMSRVDPRPKQGEIVGAKNTLVLVYPLGLGQYTTELLTATTRLGLYRARLGLYARAHDLWALREDLKNVQQGGTQHTDRPDGTPYSSPTFPERNFPMGVEVEVRFAGSPPLAYAAHVEYDGRDAKGIARLRLTPTTPGSRQSYDGSLFSWSRQTKGWVPNSFFVLQSELAASDVQLATVDRRHNTLRRRTNAWLPARESARLLVALDYRMERGLRGLQFGGLMARLTR